MLKITMRKYKLDGKLIKDSNSLINNLLKDDHYFTSTDFVSKNNNPFQIEYSGNHPVPYTLYDLFLYNAIKDYLELIYCIINREYIVNARSLIYSFLYDDCIFSDSLEPIIPQELSFSPDHFNMNTKYIIGDSVKKPTVCVPPTKTYNLDATEFISTKLNAISTHTPTYEILSSIQRDFPSYNHETNPRYYIPLSHVPVFATEYVFYANRKFHSDAHTTRETNRCLPRRGKPYSLDSYFHILKQTYEYSFSLYLSLTSSRHYDFSIIDKYIKSLVSNNEDKKASHHEIIKLHPMICRIIQFLLINDAFHFSEFVTVKSYFQKYSSDRFLDDIYKYLPIGVTSIHNYKNKLPHDILSVALDKKILTNDHALPDPLYLFDCVLDKKIGFINTLPIPKYIYDDEYSSSTENTSYHHPIIHPSEKIDVASNFPYNTKSYKILFNEVAKKALETLQHIKHYNIFALLRGKYPIIASEKLISSDCYFEYIFMICIKELFHNPFFNFLMNELSSISEKDVNDSYMKNVYDKFVPILPIYKESEK